jgi:hypothetical protein
VPYKLPDAGSQADEGFGQMHWIARHYLVRALKEEIIAYFAPIFAGAVGLKNPKH